MPKERILIFAYRFPPNKETGSFRPLGWAKYLHKFGYKPIIVTRHWDEEGHSVSHLLAPSRNKSIVHQEFDTHDVYYLPFSGNLRTKAFFNFFNTRFALVYKILSFLEKLCVPLGWYRLSMYRFMYSWADEFLAKNKEIKKAIITGAPFELFNLGALINRRYQVSWIADYRDPWSTRKVLKSDKFPYTIINALEGKAEKRWVKTASCITTTSDFFSKTIGEFVQKPAHTVYNGYLNEDSEVIATNPPKEVGVFNIIYNGNLFEFQKIELFIEGFKKVIDLYHEKCPLRLSCIGLSYFPESEKRLNKLMEGYEKFYLITPRLSKVEYLKQQQEASCLLILNTTTEGIVASKVFDYILSNVPVLAVPNDYGPIFKILNETGHGIYADSSNEVFIRLSTMIERYLQSETVPLKINQNAVDNYSRENQTRIIAGLLDQL